MILNHAAKIIQIWFRNIIAKRDLEEWRIIPSDQMKSSQKILRSQNTDEILSMNSSQLIEKIKSIDSVLDIEIQDTDLLIE